MIVLVRVSSTVDPETATAVTALAVPSAVTAKLEEGAMVEEVPVLGASTQSLASS